MGSSCHPFPPIAIPSPCDSCKGWHIPHRLHSSKVTLSTSTITDFLARIPHRGAIDLAPARLKVPLRYRMIHLRHSMCIYWLCPCQRSHWSASPEILCAASTALFMWNYYESKWEIHFKCQNLYESPSGQLFPKVYFGSAFLTFL